MKNFSPKSVLPNQLLVILLVFLFTFAGTNEIKATHSMGGDLTYECMGSGVYLWRLKLYRDCFGITPNSVQPIIIEGCGATYNLSLNQTGPIVEVSPICASQLPNTSCNGGTLPGVQLVTYEGMISLPNPCVNYVASFRLCCRNSQITTINNPGSQYMYVEAVLDNTIAPCNSSPVFGNTLTPFACVNQEINHNHLVTDPDGDQLVFSLVNCFHDVNVPLDYINPPFNGLNPLSTVSGVSLDSLTGVLSFTPNIVQVAVICIKIEEFRNGVKIGETMRDMQFAVLPCNNSAPVAGPFEENGQSTGSYNYFALANTSFCLDIPGSDLDGDNVNMTWNNGIPSGSMAFANNNTPTPVGTFCWTPTNADVGVNTFTISEVDNACPITASAITTYTVNIAPNFVAVDAKLYLEGPYDASLGKMSDQLRVNGDIPLNEPYTGLGYLLTNGGGETINPSVLSVTGDDAIVDWIVVELRDANAPTVVVASRAALLQADGDIADLNGVSAVHLDGVIPASYYVVINHRNHLSAMTATPLVLDSSPVASYDFTTVDAYGGPDAQNELGPINALYGGDINGDGSINANDRSSIWNRRNQVGYIQEDSNGSGVCDAADRSQNWNNRNTQTKVP